MAFELKFLCYMDLIETIPFFISDKNYDIQYNLQKFKF